MELKLYYSIEFFEPYSYPFVYLPEFAEQDEQTFWGSSNITIESWEPPYVFLSCDLDVTNQIYFKSKSFISEPLLYRYWSHSYARVKTSTLNYIFITCRHYNLATYFEKQFRVRINCAQASLSTPVAAEAGGFLPPIPSALEWESLPTHFTVPGLPSGTLPYWTLLRVNPSAGSGISHSSLSMIPCFKPLSVVPLNGRTPR